MEAPCLVRYVNKRSILRDMVGLEKGYCRGVWNGPIPYCVARSTFPTMTGDHELQLFRYDCRDLVVANLSRIRY